MSGILSGADIEGEAAGWAELECVLVLANAVGLEKGFQPLVSDGVVAFGDFSGLHGGAECLAGFGHFCDSTSYWVNNNAFAIASEYGCPVTCSSHAHCALVLHSKKTNGPSTGAAKSK